MTFLEVFWIVTRVTVCDYPPQNSNRSMVELTLILENQTAGKLEQSCYNKGFDDE